MAIKWGNSVNINGVTYRTGTDVSYSPTTITGSTSSVTVTTKVYIGTPGNYYASGTNLSYEVTGSESGSASGISWSFPLGGYTLVATLTETVTLNYGSTKSFTTRARIRPIFSAGTWTPYVNNNITIPARPISRPAAPTSLSVTRVKDTQQNLSWTRNSTTAAPYSSQQVYRSTNGGTAARVATLSGTATSWSDTSTVAGNVYTYYVRAINSAGNRNSTSVSISTTPTRPNAPTAVKNTTGDIVVTRPSLSPSATSWRVRDNGGATLATIPAGTSTWTHVDPNNAITHAYSIQAVSGSLSSAWSPNSATVQLLAPPNAPTNLSPNGTVLDKDKSTVLSWRHNSVDTTEQVYRQIRHRISTDNGATWGGWIEGSKVATTSENLTVSGWEGRVEWQVRTWGAMTSGGSDGTGASPWSAVASFTLSSRPMATAVSPSETVVDRPHATFEWAHYQPDGRPQTGWQIQVLDGSTVVASPSGSGTTTSWDSPEILETGQSYTWRVRTRDNLNQWSDWDSATFTVNFTPPNPPTIEAEWDSRGFMALSLAAVDDGTAPDTVSLTLQRSINGGPWETLAENLDPTTEYLDWSASPTGENVYRLIAVSSLPSTAHTDLTVTMPDAGDSLDGTCEVWLSAGPDLAITVRLWHVAERNVTMGRQRTLNQYEGRADLVETSSLHVPYAINVSVTLVPPTSGCSGTSPASREDLERVFSLPGPHLYRDGYGRYFYASLSALQYGDYYLDDATFTVTRADGGSSQDRADVGTYVGPYLVEVRPGEYVIYGGQTVEDTPGEWVWTP